MEDYYIHPNNRHLFSLLEGSGSESGSGSNASGNSTFSDHFYNVLYKSGIWTGAFFSVAATLFAVKIMWGHLKNYKEPDLQRPIVRIVLFIPVYAIDSFLSLCLPKLAMIFDTVRDVYEAYVIYIFYMLLVHYIEKSGVNLRRFLEEQPSKKHPVPLCCFTFSPGGYFAHTCKQMILQYTIIKPILAALYIITEELGVLNEGSFSPKYAYLYLIIIENISVTFALYYLVLFYMVTHEPLASFRPIAKFLCVKLVIFFTFWQSIIISLLVYLGYISDSNWGRDGYFSTALNDWLICFEMFFFSLAFGYAFGVKTYRDMPQSAKKQVLHQIASILNPKKFKSNYSDFRRVLSNFRDVLSQQDMIDETVEAFGKKGRRWLKQLEEWLDLPLYQKRQRVIKEGTLRKRAAHFSRYKERYFLLLDSPRGLVYFDANPFPSPDSSQGLLAAGSGPSGGTIAPSGSEHPDVALLEEGGKKEDHPSTGFSDLLHPPLELISVGDITSVQQDEVKDKHGWHFTIITPSREWVLCAQSHPEMEEWISAIKRLAEAEKIQTATEEVGGDV